jgi:hypothetical protein
MIAQTFTDSGILLATVTIRSDAEYSAHLRAMVEQHGDNVYTVCTEDETEQAA